MEVLVANVGIMAIFAGIRLWSSRKRCRAERVVGVVCFLVAGCFADRLWSLVMEGIAQADTWKQLQYAGLALSKCVAGILLFPLCMWDRAEAQERESDKRMDYVERLTAAGSVFFWCVLNVTGAILRGGEGSWDTRPRRDGRLEVDFVWTLLLFLILMGFYLSVCMHGRAERDRQARRSRQEEHRQTEVYLAAIENNYQRTRELWHDLRNHISLLNLLLQEEKYEQMRDYLKVFGEETGRIALPAKSGNLIVDAVLTDKAARAGQEHIAVEIELCDLTRLPLKADEICSLLGNLLDNAIEACLQVRGERKITVICRVREDETYISVRNTMAAEASKEGVRRVSRKKGRENVVGHGLGLRSVERVVNRYRGEFVTDAGEGIFTAAVWIPGEEVPEEVYESNDLHSWSKTFGK